jgi:hypothetical protein
MKRSFQFFTRMGCVVLMLASQTDSVRAGWAGLVNGKNIGWASVNVRSSTLNTNNLITLTNMSLPSAAMFPVTGYRTNSTVPSGTASTTYARLKSYLGGVWQGTGNAAVGDGVDNPELQQRVKITPADCAFLTFDSKINQTDAEFAANGNSGTISVDAKATAGTALWLRGFEFTGSMADVPADDPSTVQNEGIEYLKLHGVQKFETLVLGPFEFGGPNGCPLVVPFTLSSSNLEHLVVATDAAALSLPMVIECPENIVASCQDSISYGVVKYAGCGDITITYSKPPPANGVFPAGSFPVGVTPVTVTASDAYGNSTNCTFTVTVTDTTAPVVPELPVLTGEAMVTVPQPPSVMDNCGGIISATTTNPLVYTTQGNFTVNWVYDDGNRNIAVAQQVVVVDDVTAPTPVTLPTLTGQCSVTVPTPETQDAVSGKITGVTADPIEYTSQGTFTVNWVFDDGNGNVRTATQTVIVKDTMAPVPPTLPTVTGNCSSPAVLTRPTATDNCANAVLGTTTSPLSYSTPGTYVVTWSFSDGNGNTSTATQTVVVTGLEFHGFYPPINGTGGSCSSPIFTATLGNNVPVKFDTTCGGLPYGLGLPTLAIERVVNTQNCTLAPAGGGNFTLVGSEWHFNFNTAVQTKGVYKLTVTLQDGSTRFFWMRVK